MKNFKRNSNFIGNAVKFIFIFTFVLIIAQLVLYVWLGYSILNNPESVGEIVGKVGKGVVNGLE